LFLQGTTSTQGGQGSPFGDGLRCVSGFLVRLGFRQASAGRADFGLDDGSATTIAARGLVPAAGYLRHHQVWYRDAASYYTSATFNLSNALSIGWAIQARHSRVPESV